MKNKFLKIFCCLIILVGICGCGKSENNANSGNDNLTDKIEKKLQIVDENSTSRPYAVMINNHHASWPQSGLQDAYLVYEIVVEGGITRMMALYKDQSTKKIGSIRSARYYFLDYVLENDAIYAHFGWNDLAKDDVATLGIDNINGLYDNYTWRDTSFNRDYVHAVFTSINNIKKQVTKKGYRTETNQDLLLNYSVDEIDLKSKNGSIIANNVSIKYSNYHTTSYEYDKVNKVYKRSMSDVANTDLITGEQYTVKNIITYQVEDVTHEKDTKVRKIKNIGSGEGYYITNGYAVPITWEKSSRNGKTIYKYKNGEEITVNDGNTFIQIQPLNQPLIIS